MKLELENQKTQVFIGVLAITAFSINWYFWEHRRFRSADRDFTALLSSQPTQTQNISAALVQKTEPPAQVQNVAIPAQITVITQSLEWYKSARIVDRPIQVPQPSQQSWPNGVSPTRKYKVPNDLTFKPDNDGKYRWSEHIRDGDDIQIELEKHFRLEFQANADQAVFEASMRRSPDGQWIDGLAGELPSVDMFRFRIKPKVRHSVEIQLRTFSSP